MAKIRTLPDFSKVWQTAEFESVFSKAERGVANTAYLSKNWQPNLRRTWFGESEQKIADVRPQMIALLYSTRNLLEKLSQELGVTDPVSGTVVSENK